MEEKEEKEEEEEEEEEEGMEKEKGTKTRHQKKRKLEGRKMVAKPNHHIMMSKSMKKSLPD